MIEVNDLMTFIIHAGELVHGHIPGVGLSCGGMKNLTIILIAIATACAPSITVSSDQDPNQDFEGYTYFAWGPEEEHRNTLYPMFDNELNRQRVQQAIHGQLGAIGLVHDPERAQILVDYHIAITAKTAVDTYHSEQEMPWVAQQVEVFDYTEGTLVVHLVDVKTNRLVWQGTAVSVLRPNSKQVDERINKAVQKIFEQYPGLI